MKCYALLLAFVCTVPLSAQTLTWTNDAPNNNWSDGDNWFGGVAPVPFDPSQTISFTGFGLGSGDAAVNDFGGITLDTMFMSGSYNFPDEISGGSITLQRISNQASGTLNISNDIRLLPPTARWTSSRSNSLLRFTGEVDIGSTTLRLAGSGDMTFSEIRGGARTQTTSAVVITSSGGVGRYEFRSGNLPGTISVQTVNTPAEVVISGDMLSTRVNITGAGELYVNGSLNEARVSGPNSVFSPGISAGSIGLAEMQNLRLDAPLAFDLDGIFRDVIEVSGTVFLGSRALILNVTSPPAIGETVTLVSKTSGGAVTGRFFSLPEGGLIAAEDGLSIYRITYSLPSGGFNDIAITRVEVPVPVLTEIRVTDSETDPASFRTVIIVGRNAVLGQRIALFRSDSLSEFAEIRQIDASSNGVFAFIIQEPRAIRKRFYRISAVEP